MANLVQDRLDVVVVGFALKLAEQNFRWHPLRGEVGSERAFVTIEDAVEISVWVEDDAVRPVLELVQWSTESILGRGRKEETDVLSESFANAFHPSLQ